MLSLKRSWIHTKDAYEQHVEKKTVQIAWTHEMSICCEYEISIAFISLCLSFFFFMSSLFDIFRITWFVSFASVSIWLHEILSLLDKYFISYLQNIWRHIYPRMHHQICYKIIFMYLPSPSKNRKPHITAITFRIHRTIHVWFLQNFIIFYYWTFPLLLLLLC